MGASRRVIRDLKRAELLDKRPPFIPNQNKRIRGARRAGLIYEQKVADMAKAIHSDAEVVHGPWIKYWDIKGEGWCQPDLLFLPEDVSRPLIIGECKLTATPAAERKLRHIYKPVVEMIYPQYETYKLIQICKNLTQDFDDILIRSFAEMWNLQDDCEYVTLNLRDIPK